MQELARKLLQVHHYKDLETKLQRDEVIYSKLQSMRIT